MLLELEKVFDLREGLPVSTANTAQAGRARAGGLTFWYASFVNARTTISLASV